MSIQDTFNAAELARSAAVEDAKNADFVGVLVSVDTDEDRIATYLFEAALPGYGGWRWAVTIAKLEDDAPATICDVVLLPGSDSLIAPEWIPYKDRLLPGDEELDPSQLFEFGLGRARVLSIVGRDLASKRWYEGDRGPNTPMAQSAPKPCYSCGFFIPIAGSLRSAFGVCANILSPEDARVVSVDHGCGAHSEALVVAD